MIRALFALMNTAGCSVSRNGDDAVVEIRITWGEWSSARAMTDNGRPFGPITMGIINFRFPCKRRTHEREYETKLTPKQIESKVNAKLSDQVALLFFRDELRNLAVYLQRCEMRKLTTSFFYTF